MEKKEFNIVVTETLRRVVKVTAEDCSDAVNQVVKRYREKEIILDAEDYTTTDIDIDEEPLKKYYDLPEFQEFLNRNVSDILVDCTMEELIMLAFGSMESALYQFEVEMG